MINKNEIIKAWATIRKNDCSIPDEVLDYMKNSSIEKLELQESKSCDGCKNKGTHIFNMDCLICSRHYSDGYILKDT